MGGFRLISGDREERYIVEANSGGVCDRLRFGRSAGFLLRQQRTLGELPGGPPFRVRHALFRNVGERRFEEVTRAAGAGGNGYRGMGCSVTDYDSDGLPDLYVKSYGPNQLLRNQGDGTLADATEHAGMSDPRWSTGSTWSDVDRDGALDLFVANYIELDPANLPGPGSPVYGPMERTGLGCKYMGLPVMCGPQGLEGAEDSFFMNQGDGSFEQCSRTSGLDDAEGYFGLGALFVNLDEDGLPDLFVANDSTPNLFYGNLGNAMFEVLGLLSGLAFNAHGVEQAGMGVAAGDYLN